MVGGTCGTSGGVTVSVMLCVAFGSLPLLTPIVNVWVPAAVVSAMVMRPVVLLMVTPSGALVRVKVKVSGVPSASTWKVAVVPASVVLLS